MATSKMQQILERRKAAARAAKSGNTVPVNGPARVEPVKARPRVEALKPQRAATTASVPEDDDEGDEEPTVVSRATRRATPASATPSKSTLEGRKSDRMAQRALTVQKRPAAGALALPMADRTRQMDQSDMIMPRLKISQAMSKVNTDDLVRQGNFYRSPQNKSLGAEIYVVIVDMTMSRSYFEQGQGVICRSWDMVKGEGDPGLYCEGDDDERELVASGSVGKDEVGCPLRLWGERDENGRSTPPACGKNYNYPLLLLSEDDMAEGKTAQAVWTLRSTATRVAKEINTIVAENDGVWTSCILKISAVRQSNTKGTYYVPQVEYWGETTGTVKRKAERFAQTLVGRSVRASIEADRDD